VSLSDPFIRRPVATTLLTLAIALAGAIAYRFLPVSPLPQVDFPTISVSASLPGADPETMATSVAAPLERQFGRIAGVTEMTSTSYRGSTSITLQFDLDRDINGAARDVQAAINAARGYLPSNMPSNPTYRKVNPADAPVLILGLTSETHTRAQLYDAAATVLQQKLAQVGGVGQVFVGGGSLPAVRVELNPAAVAQYGLSLEQVRGVLAKTNVNRPKGQVTHGETAWEVQTNDQLKPVAASYEPLVLAYRSGAAVRLADVADVTEGVEDTRAAGFVDGKPSVMLVIFRQPGANIIETVDSIRAMLPRLESALPGGMILKPVVDRSPPIRGSLHDVEMSMLLSCALVILVVFLFLRSFRATVIPGVATVVSLVGTFAIIYLCGYSLDNLSLMALTIATGFVVDDAIVVLENITRHVEAGMQPLKAAFQGAREISFTVVSMSVSLVAVFLPILLMGGMVGRLFREFAVTLSAAIFVSMLLSLTTTPMMCAYLLRPPGQERTGRFVRATEGAFQAMHAMYERTLRVALRHKRITLAAAVGMLALNVVLYSMVPKGFFPQQDTGRLSGNIQAAQDVSFTVMEEKLKQVVAIIKQDQDVQHVTGFIGGTGGGGSSPNTARIFVTLAPFEKRGINAEQVMMRLRKKLSGLPGAPTYLQLVQDLRVGGRGSSALYQFTLQAESVGDLNVWAPRLLAKMRTLPQVVDVNSDQQDKGLMSQLTIDRSTASRLGITPKRIDNILYDAFGQRQVAITYSPLNQYHVVMEASPRLQLGAEGLRSIFVPAGGGQMIPLEVFTRHSQTTTALAVNHQGQFPSVTISFNLAPGTALGQAVTAIEAAARDLGLPGNIRGSFQGTAQAFQAALANQPLLILAALISVYIVLGMLYESLVHPVTILSTLPSAGVGAVFALIVTGTDLSVIAIIGIILLIGIVKKNGIMMVDFAIEAERRGGLSPEEAITRACLLRFRPIMMTTMAALLGAVPLALGTGVGSELRRPLGIAIIGGLAFSQAMTLYTTPVVYLYLERLRLWTARRKGKATDKAPGGHAPATSAET
jgi:multidrug efflux pump